jgi:hypothetical protein
MMGLPWTTLLRWLLPSIPEIVTTVRSLKQDRRSQPRELFASDVRERLDKLESALELQVQLTNDLARRLQHAQTRLHLAIIAALVGVIVSLVAISIALFR